MLLGSVELENGWRETKVVFKSIYFNNIYISTRRWRETKVVFKFIIYKNRTVYTSVEEKQKLYLNSY